MRSELSDKVREVAKDFVIFKPIDRWNEAADVSVELSKVKRRGLETD